MNEKNIKSLSDKVTVYADSLFKPVNDRMSNALSGSFIISVLAFNWRTIVYLCLSKTTIAESFTYIDKFIYVNANDKFNMFILYPITVSLIYNFVVPALTELMEVITHRFKISNQKRNQKILSGELVHNIEVSGLLAQAERQKIEFDELRDITEKIQEFNKLIEIKDQEIKDLNDKLLESAKKAAEESSKHNEAISDQYKLNNEIESLKLGLKTILSSTVSNEPLSGQSDNSQLISLIYKLDIPDKKFKEELSDIIKKSAEVSYRVIVRSDDNENISSLLLDNLSIAFENVNLITHSPNKLEVKITTHNSRAQDIIKFIKKLAPHARISIDDSI